LIEDATLGEFSQRFGGEANLQGGKLCRSAVVAFQLGPRKAHEAKRQALIGRHKAREAAGR
jgi:hypothetical protein